jgi:hypothetical protein
VKAEKREINPYALDSDVPPFESQRRAKTPYLRCSFLVQIKNIVTNAAIKRLRRRGVEAEGSLPRGPQRPKEILPFRVVSWPPFPILL